MPDSLYDRDVLLWSEEQAGLLRRLEAGERVNDAVDWPNLIEEVEALGRSELRACESLLAHALEHLLKLHRWPTSQARAHWRREVIGFLAGATRAFAPSMRQRLSLPALFADARYAVEAAEDESGPGAPLPADCPYVLDALLTTRADVDALVSRLGDRPGSNRLA